MLGGTIQSSTATATHEIACTMKAGKLDFYDVGNPGAVSVHGKSSSLAGTFFLDSGELNGELRVPSDSFTTGLKLRDHHLKQNVFESSKFPDIFLKITSLKVPAEPGKHEKLPFMASLHLHGVIKKVMGLADITLTEKNMKLSAHLDIKLSDYGITPPEFKGMQMKYAIKIHATGIANLDTK